MRALFMDFKGDKNTWNLGKEFMFGHSILVCPVTDPLYTKEKVIKTDEQSGWNKQADNSLVNGWPAVNWNEKKQYSVYLPAGASWYDYWTNTKLNGGQTIKADAPISHSPLYIKAGSIIPVGQDLQYSNEKPWDNMTLRVYPGANASFTLYEDEGNNYDYQKGMYTEIPMMWNDKTHTLTIKARRGTYPGMLAKRRFHIEVMTADKSIGKTVTYIGKNMNIKL